jgi:putative Ca2+/H+ antiporter (TMEM165/GDT1 family)
VFGVTVTAFFLAEMGDKTQIATAVLGARFHALVQVVAGTTLGMLIADVPAVFAGHLAAGRIPFKLVHAAAAVLFAALGVGVLVGY